MATHVPIADLVLDYTLYPRHQVNDTHVKDLMLALEAGAPLHVARRAIHTVAGQAGWRWPPTARAPPAARMLARSRALPRAAQARRKRQRRVDRDDVCALFRDPAPEARLCRQRRRCPRRHTAIRSDGGPSRSPLRTASPVVADAAPPRSMPTAV